MTQSGIERQLELQQYTAVLTVYDNSAIKNVFHAIFGVENSDSTWTDSNIAQRMENWSSRLQSIKTASATAKNAYLKRIEERCPLTVEQYALLEAIAMVPYQIAPAEDDISEKGTSLELTYEITDKAKQKIDRQIAMHPDCIQAYIKLVIEDNYRLISSDIELIAHLFSIKIYLHQGIDIAVYNDAVNSVDEVHLVLARNRLVERMIQIIFSEEQKQFIRTVLEWQETRYAASVDVNCKTDYTLVDGTLIKGSVDNMASILGMAIAAIKTNNLNEAKHYLAQLYTEHSQCFDMLFQKYDESLTSDDKYAYALSLVLLYPEKRENYFLLFNYSMSTDNLVLANDCRKNIQMLPGHSSSEQDMERQFFYYVLGHAATRKDVLNFAEHYFLRYAIEGFSEQEFQEDILAILEWLERVEQRTPKANKWHNDLVYNLSLLYMRKNDILNLSALVLQYPSNNTAVTAYLAVCFQTDDKETGLQEFINNCSSINPVPSTLQACLHYAQGCISSDRIEQLKFFMAAAKCKEDVGKFMKLHLGYYWIISFRDENFLKQGCELLNAETAVSGGLHCIEFLNAYWLGLVLLTKKMRARHIYQKYKNLCEAKERHKKKLDKN